MANIRIGVRLMLGFGLIVLLTLALGGYALRKQSDLQRLTQDIDDRDFTTLENLQEITRGEDQMRASREAAFLAALLNQNHLTAESPRSRESEWTRLRDRNAKLLSDLENTARTMQTSAITSDRALGWEKISSAMKDADDSLRAISPLVEGQFALLNTGSLSEAAGRQAEIEAASSDYQSKLTVAQRLIHDQIDLGRQEVIALATETRNSIVVVLVIAILLAVLFSIVIHRSITYPLQEFMRLVERVGQGDLTQKVTVARADEIGDLGKSLDSMVNGLKDVASQTRLVAESLNTATAEILASTQQQAAATAEQAAAVQQANATMTEISQSGAQISERARQVATAAEATSSASASGLQSVRNTTQIMDSIREQAEAVATNVISLSEKTQAIGQIITTVNDIAEQSHLLALNAAIQAAVAGEQGRSFSVVANEMKNLAAQSKQATVQVRGILGDIQKGITTSVMLTEEAVKRADSGRQQANVADQTIRKLTESVEESVRAFQQIVGGSGQQQIGFEQVTHAFRNISVATQQTATSTKQSEKAASNLSSLAQELRSAVARYRV
ncbi:MAG TPA: methyl-accepting chemotaxis protein [Bryobacteraceae bacterium]|nr:methyl-accepting chemotaxis protein [Bryobacteraceae bacterium]